jgi:hypothetical protein
VDKIAMVEGVVGITLSSATKQFFNIIIPEDQEEAQPKSYWLNWKQVKLHVFTHGEASEFFIHYDIIKVNQMN